MDIKKEQTIPPLVGGGLFSAATIEGSNPLAANKPGPELATGMIVLASLAAIAAGYFASVVFIPIILSFFLFVLLDPLVTWLNRRNMPRKFTSPLVVFLFIAFFSLFVGAGYGTFARLAEHLPEYGRKIKTQLSSVQGKFKSIQKNTSTILPKDPNHEEIQKVEVVEKFGGSWTEYLFRGLNSIFGIVTTALLIPILAVFLLLEKEYLASQLKAALEPKISLDFVANEVNQMVKGFFLGNLVVGLVTSLGFFFLFLALDLENQVPLALFSGFINLIPILGAFLGAILPMAQCYLQFDSASPLLIVMSISIFLHFFVANVIMPKVVGSRINVNATAATIGLVFWGWMWGAIGLLLAIPLTALIRIFLASQAPFRTWSNILAENPMGPLSRLTFSIQGLKRFSKPRV
ncbi:MAG: AI-2E family transporter [Bdellovibrionia bacterium]